MATGAMRGSHYMRCVKPAVARGPQHRLFAVVICPDIAGSTFATQDLDGRAKSLLPDFDQLGFLSFLFAEGERRLSVSFQCIQVRAGSLKQSFHLRSPLFLFRSAI
jgi:hypothetical protein